MRNPVKRGSVALATALCLFLALATPASANTVSLTIKGGSLTAAGNTFTLGTTVGDPPCDEKVDDLKAESLGNVNSGTVRLFGPTIPVPPPAVLPHAWSSMFQLGTPPSGQWYQADFFILNQTVPQFTYTLAAAGPPTWTYNVASIAPNHLIIQVRIFRIGPPEGDCEKTELACIINVRMSLTGTLESTTAMPTFTPTTPTPPAGAVTVSGASVGNMTVASCSAPFTSWNGQPASVTNLALG